MVCHTSLYGTASVQSGNDRAAAADASNATNPATATEVAAGAPRTSLFGGDRVAARLGQAANSTSKTDDTTMADNADAKSSAVQTGGIHYYCSAAHLKVASKTFEKALSGEWVESMRKDDGRYHIVVEDWDEEALLILLNVLHAKYDEVPRTVDLELLAKLVTVIDYYQCREATALITEKWLGDALAKSGPSNFFARPLILWLYVAVVFRHSGIFELATKHIVELGVDGSLRNLGLPIPQVVSERVDRLRIFRLNTYIHELKALAQRYKSAVYVCPVSKGNSLACGSLMYGALAKELERLKLSRILKSRSIR